MAQTAEQKRAVKDSKVYADNRAHKGSILHNGLRFAYLAGFYAGVKYAKSGDAA